MGFLKNLNDRLTIMEREMQTLSGELDSIVARLDQGKLQSILIHLEKDCDQLFKKHSAAQRMAPITLPLVMESSYPFFRQITDEDLFRWREAYKSDIQVVIGKGRVKVMTASEVTGKRETAVSQITPVTEQQGYIVLGWDQYQKLLAEIGKLISDDEERARSTGYPDRPTTPK